MKEIQGKDGEQRRGESCGEIGTSLSGVGGIEINESWVREDIWTKEPTPETVERLIEWFSDKRN